MKLKLLILAIMICAAIASLAQNPYDPPTSFAYQAVARDNTGNLITNQNTSLRFSIHVTSAAGAVVYQETQSVITNSLGLFAVNIGEGNVIIGPFSVINWSSGSKFVQVEMDVNGGNNYVDVGTQQMLSVPYALYSANSKQWNVNGSNINNTNVGNVGIGTINPAQKLDVFGTTKTTNFQMTNDAGANRILQSDANGNASWVTPVVSGIHTIGESYGGGIVFYVYDGGLHGLIAATNDQSAGIQWYNGNFRYTNTLGDGLGAGVMNTTLITATQTADNQIGNFAAKVCADYSVTVGGITYGDWYLPSRYELNLLYLQKSIVGGFASAFYWSSNEVTNINAWYLFFSNGVPNVSTKNSALFVRAVRAF